MSKTEQYSSYVVSKEGGTREVIEVDGITSFGVRNVGTSFQQLVCRRQVTFTAVVATRLLCLFFRHRLTHPPCLKIPTSHTHTDDVLPVASCWTRHFLLRAGGHVTSFCRSFAAAHFATFGAVGVKVEAAWSFETSVVICTRTLHCNGETTDVPSNTMYPKLSLSFIFFPILKISYSLHAFCFVLYCGGFILFCFVLWWFDIVLFCTVVV